MVGEALGINDWSHNLPSSELSGPVESLGHSQRGRLVRALTTGVDALASTLYEPDPAGLVRAAFQTEESHLLATITDILGRIPPQSTSARTLRAVLTLHTNQ